MENFRYHWKQLVRGLALESLITHAQILERVVIDDDLEGYLIDDIVMPRSRRRYLFVLTVVSRSTRKPYLWVTAKAQEGPPFLCLDTVDQQGYNFGQSDSYENRAQFLSAALEQVRRFQGRPEAVFPYSWKQLVQGLQLGNAILGAHILERVEMNDSRSEGYLLGDIEMSGLRMEYLFVLAIVDSLTGRPYLWVNSELSQADPFLCLEDGRRGQRLNLGSSEAYRNQAEFLSTAIARARTFLIR